MRLYEIAHARSGDKGDINNIVVIAYKMQDYAYLREHLTAERVKEFFGSVVKGAVVRYEAPLVGALNFVMYGALGGGVTRTLNLDAHGKTLSSYLLNMEI